MNVYNARGMVFRLVGSLVTFLLVAVVSTSVYAIFLDGPWLSFDGPELVDTRQEAIDVSERVPGAVWPGTRIAVEELADGSLAVERIWIGLSEAELVVSRQGLGYSVPVDGLSGLTDGLGETVQQQLFLLPAVTAAAAVYLFLRRRARDRARTARSDLVDSE